MNTKNIILSTLSADAYSLGAHWVYDEVQLKNLPINWQGLNDAQAMWHKDKKKGDFTHYGDQTLFLLEYISTNKSFDTQDYYTFWSKKMQDYDGYIDGATRNALGAMGSQNNDLSITGRFSPLLLLSQTKEEFFNSVKELTQITHNSALATQTTEFFAQLLWESNESQDIIKSIKKLKSNYPLLEKWIEEGLNSKDNDTFTSIRNFGPACGIDGGFAGAIHLLSLDDDFTTLMIKNAKAGGDSSARGMVVAMILATQDNFMMNDEWVDGMNVIEEIKSYL
jgi:ADP-ribosylglycohydrolase